MIQKPETWLPIAGYETLYDVSDAGRVRSLNRRIRTKNGEIRMYEGLVLAASAGYAGYPEVKLSKHSKTKTERVHVLVAAAFIGPRPDGLDVRHLDGDPTNNAVGNLEYGTHQSNMHDMVRHGRSNAGTRNPMAQLTADDVHEIRRRIARRDVQQGIADDFGISASAVTDIKKGRTWAHLPAQPPARQ